MPFRCLIVDDHAGFLGAARALLEQEGIDVVGVASTKAEALQRAKELRPEVTLVDVESSDGVLQLSIRDDGAGGADPSRGSGLIGLTDRVEALGGTIEVVSPPGEGTSLLVTLPVEASSSG
jgi:DNA-binding NarL/FixJ family response regulator